MKIIEVFTMKKEKETLANTLSCAFDVTGVPVIIEVGGCNIISIGVSDRLLYQAFDLLESFQCEIYQVKSV